MSRSQRLHHALINTLTPDLLTITDESFRHHVPEGAETHFKVVLVSSQFNGLTRIARHRLVNSHLRDEFTSGLHALSLHLYTPQEWQKYTPTIASSPACLDGYDSKEG